MTKTEKTKRINYFKNRVNYYFYDVFKLVDFQLIIKEQENDCSRVSTYWHPIDTGAGQILICYSKHWIESTGLTRKEIDMSAFHETWEAILWEMQDLMRQRFISEKDIPNATHRVIRRMENVIHPLVSNI
jgi:hypothetical protein